MSSRQDYLNFVLDSLQGNGGLSGTARGVARQTASAAAGTAAGGLLAGPGGALFGGIIGGLYGYFTTESYSSLFSFYNTLADDDRRKVTEKIQGYVGSTSINDFTGWITRDGNRDILVTMLIELMRHGISSMGSSDAPSSSASSSSRGRPSSSRNGASPPPSAPPYGFYEPPPPYSN
ncbi:unnamed protein product, partial [Mesorhabditis spiculigera]